MSLSRVTDWSDGQVLTSSALEAEFDNIYNNGRSLINPMTGDLDFNGNDITGLSAGSVSAPSLSFTGDSNTGIYRSAADTFDIACGGEATASFTVDGVFTLTSVDAGATGPIITTIHDSASPADNDLICIWNMKADDDTGTSRVVGQIECQFEDVTSTTMDSRMLFAVMNAANAVDANTSAQLTSLGAWTDASAAAGKEYEGDLEDVFGKVKQLTTLGVYHGKNVAAEKLAKAERHYSPTAEEFYEVFKLGIDPARGHPGIAAKDVAWIAVKMALELDSRLSALELA